jgi:UPF0176 protein
VLKIKVKKVIVADGINDSNFSVDQAGSYIDSATFNKFIADPAVLIVDMRNNYEYEVGHFSNAINVPSETFREQLATVVTLLTPHKQKTIAMYCTGGIRCEKASAWLRYNGFHKVYHLHGGIINYLNSVKSQYLPNYFLGTNFVFDHRLGEKATDIIISRCHQCQQPAAKHVNCALTSCHLLFIQCEACSTKFAECCSTTCMDKL